MKQTPLLHIFVLISFLTNTFGPIPIAQAQEFRLPAAGVMVRLSPPLNPPMLKGVKVHPDNPFRFDFILDQGDSVIARSEATKQSFIKEEAAKLIKYFLASLTIPEKDLWVNLSPYEKDRIIPDSFGLTEMGRDLLAEDYMLKQITASLIYPEDEVGKKFWKRIYEETQKKFGTTNIPVNTFNKVWIVPEKAIVYENAKAGTAYVVESKLKVMLEEDYLSMSKHADGGVAERGASPASAGFGEHAGETRGQDPDINKLGSDIVREIVIPELTKEVNENKNFAQLRQVYNSLILATWYKKKIKDSILSQVYADKNKVAGVNIDDPQEKEKIYQQYLSAFKKGVYNYIKEESDPVTQETVPRKYFSGGVNLAMSGTTNLETGFAMKFVHNFDTDFKTDDVEVTANFAMSSDVEQTGHFSQDAIQRRIALWAEQINHPTIKDNVGEIKITSDKDLTLRMYDRLNKLVDEGKIIKINLSALSGSKKKTYQFLIKRLRDIAYSMVRGSKINLGDKGLFIFELLKNAFVYGNHLKWGLPIYVKIDNQQNTAKVFDFNLESLGMEADKEAMKASEGILHEKGEAVKLVTAYGYRYKRADVTAGSEVIGRMVEIDFAMQTAPLRPISIPEYEALQKVSEYGNESVKAIDPNQLIYGINIWELYHQVRKNMIGYFRESSEVEALREFRRQFREALGRQLAEKDEMTESIRDVVERTSNAVFPLLINEHNLSLRRGHPIKVKYMKDSPERKPQEITVEGELSDFRFNKAIDDLELNFTGRQALRLSLTPDPIQGYSPYIEDVASFLMKGQQATNRAMISEQDIVTNALNKIMQEITKDKVAATQRLEELQKIWIGKIRKFIENAEGKTGKDLFKAAARSFHPDLQVDKSAENLSVSCFIFSYVMDRLESSEGSTEFSRNIRKDVSSVYMDYRRIMSRNALEHRIPELREKLKLLKHEGIGFLESTVAGDLKVKFKSGQIISFTRTTAVSLTDWTGYLFVATLQDGQPIYFRLELTEAEPLEQIADNLLPGSVKREFGFFREPIPIMSTDKLKKAISNIIEQNKRRERGFYDKFSFKDPEIDGQFEAVCFGETLKFENVLEIFAQGGLIYLAYKQNDFLKYVTLGWKDYPKGVSEGYSELIGDAQQAFMSIYQYEIERQQQGRSAFVSSMGGSQEQASSKNEAMKAEQPAGVYFAWQTYMTMVLQNTLFPSNPDLVVDFKEHPDKYPFMKEIFEEANTLFPGVDFFALLGAKLADVDPSIVRIGNILFSYGLVKEWLENGKVSLQGINFTSGGVFPALLLSESMTLKKGLPFIKRFFDDAFARAKKIQEDSHTTSVILKGGPNEDILNLVKTIILVNSSLNQITFNKEYRANNIVVVNGESKAVDVVSDIFIHGGNSIYVTSGKYNAPEWMGDLILADPRHQAVKYIDLPVHTPALEPPEWWDQEVKNLGLKEPKFPVFGQTYKTFSTKGGKSIEASLKEALFGFINTAGVFEELSHHAPRIALVGAPDGFIKDVKNVVPYHTFVLRSPDQSVNPGMLVSGTAENRAMKVSVARKLSQEEADGLMTQIAQELNLKLIRWGDNRVGEISSIPWRLMYQDREVYRYDGILFKGLYETRNPFIRIGYLFFFDKTYFNQLSPDLKRRIGNNVVFLNSTDGNIKSDLGHDHQPYNFYTTAMIHQMMIDGAQDYDGIDSGAGDGILSIVWHKLSGGTVELIENKRGRMALARKQMALNDMVEGRDFYAHSGDMTDDGFIKTVSNQIRARLEKSGRKAVVFSNIGTWPDGYGKVTNQNGMKILEYVPQAQLFLAGGYAPPGYTPGVGATEAHTQYIVSDQKEIQRLGFSVLPGGISEKRTFDSYLVAWAAQRNPLKRISTGANFPGRNAAMKAEGSNEMLDDYIVSKLRPGYDKKYAKIREAEAQGTGQTDWNRPQKAMGEEVEAAIHGRDSQALNVLNLGAGDGAGGGMDLVKRGLRNTHIDLSVEAINLFRDRVRETAAEMVDRNQFEAGDMLDILRKLKDESFDIVHAHLSLQYHSKEKLHQILKEIRRVLKPDGKFLFKVHSMEDTRLVDSNKWRQLEEGESFYEMPNGEITRFFTENFISQILKDAGFKLSSPLKKIIVEGWYNKPWVVIAQKNSAQLSSTGGIDLTPAKMNLQTKIDSSPTAQNDSIGDGNDNGSGIQFHMDPAMLQQLRDAPGFVPVIINVQPLNNLREFLGM